MPGASGCDSRKPTPIAEVRSAIVEVLGLNSDGSPLPGGAWTQRYAARRIAWHILDHAWEIEDRSEPASAEPSWWCPARLAGGRSGIAAGSTSTAVKVPAAGS